MTITFAQWSSPVTASFNTASDWSGGVVPGANTDATLTAFGSAYTVTSTVTNRVDELVVGALATLAVSTGTFIVYSALNRYSEPQSAATNNGTITIGAGARMILGQSSSPSSAYGFLFNTGAINLTGSKAAFAFDAPSTTLRGAGTITLASGTSIIGGSTTSSLHNRDNTISGAGTIGSALLTLQNAKLGVIDANASTAMTINTGTNTVGNSGTIETTGAGGLIVESGVNDQGTLIAGGTGALTLIKATVSGGGDVAASVSHAAIKLETSTLSIAGTISTVVGSSITSVSATTNTIDSSDVENAGLILVQNSSTLVMGAYVANTGTVELDSTGTATTLEIDTGSTSFQGTGKLLLSNNAENQIISNGSQVQLTNRSTMVGAGTIGDADLRFVNLAGGLVDANGSVGLTIIGDSASGESTDYNNALMETTGAGGLTIEGIFGNAGTLAASGSGALLFNGATLTSGGGTIETTASGASVVFDNSSVSGGTLTLVAGSSMTLTGGSANSVLEAVYNNGTVHVGNGATLIGSDNHWANTGLIELDGTTAATKWEVGSPSATFAETLMGAARSTSPAHRIPLSATAQRPSCATPTTRSKAPAPSVTPT